jgi:hypothetical protein
MFTETVERLRRIATAAGIWEFRSAFSKAGWHLGFPARNVKMTPFEF